MGRVDKTVGWRGWSALGFGLACLMAGQAASGCRSSGPKVPHSESLASVIVRGKGEEAIGRTTAEVFGENLYAQVYAGPGRLVFEKPGGRMRELAYGGWFDSEVWVRIKVQVSRFGADAHLLACDTFIVRDHGNSVFEEEQKLRKISKRPYQKMLNEVKARLEVEVP